MQLSCFDECRVATAQPQLCLGELYDIAVLFVMELEIRTLVVFVWRLMV